MVDMGDMGDVVMRCRHKKTPENWGFNGARGRI